MRQTLIVGVIVACTLSGCFQAGRPTASAIINVKTNTTEVISFVHSGECARILTETGIAIQRISAQPYRDTSLIEVRVVAPTEKDALTAAAAVVELLKKRREATDKTATIQQMLNDPRNKTESPEMDNKVAAAIAEQHPQSSIEIVESPRILVQENPRAVNEKVRIISARKTTPQERRHYEEGQ